MLGKQGIAKSQVRKERTKSSYLTIRRGAGLEQGRHRSGRWPPGLQAEPLPSKAPVLALHMSARSSCRSCSSPARRRKRGW